MSPLRLRKHPCDGGAILRQPGALKDQVLCEVAEVSEDVAESDDVTIAQLLDGCNAHGSGLQPKADPPRGRRKAVRPRKTGPRKSPMLQAQADPPRGRRKAARPRKTAPRKSQIMPVIGRGGICFDDLSPPQQGKRLRTWRAGVLADQRGATAAMDWSDGGGNNDSQAYEIFEANTKERTPESTVDSGKVEVAQLPPHRGEVRGASGARGHGHFWNLAGLRGPQVIVLD